MAKNLKDVRDDNKDTIQGLKLDCVDKDIIALSKELEKLGVKASKILDSCEAFTNRVTKQIPRDTAPLDQVLILYLSHIIALELHIKTSYLRSDDFGNTVLRFCYEHFQGLCIQKGLIDENGNLKEN